MKKTFLFIVLIGIMLGIGIWIFKTNNDSLNYQAQRSSTNKNNLDEIDIKSTQSTTDTQQVTEQTEKEIANFSTKIHNKEKARQNNMRITCDSLTNTEIKPEEIFSFCNTVGKATKEKGYQEADVYVDGEKKQGLGGGNCQVSTTLYNAVLKVDGLEIIERHEHSGYVPYIEKGKDAAVAYGSYDFKFKNNTNKTIKIIMECQEKDVTAKIIEMVKDQIFYLVFYILKIRESIIHNYEERVKLNQLLNRDFIILINEILLIEFSAIRLTSAILSLFK